MKVSLSWLQDYADFTKPANVLAEMLTMAGLEVEAVEDRYQFLERVVVGRILSVTPHPNADTLKLCRVELESGSIDVVCGAPNAEKGMLAPLALPGAELPGGITVQKSIIRGQASYGMLCSQGELGLGPDRSGLMNIRDNTAPGTPLNKALGLTDPVLDISLTPNRADCLSFMGVAREIAGFEGTRIKRPDIELPQSDGNIKEMTSVIIHAADHCPRYAARLVVDVKVAPSPFWLQDRLLSVGLRPINNIVDITNYILMETGQPLHAFDFDFLEDNRIEVRTATAGEPFTTLDNKERRLEQDMLMICDGKKPVAVGGVMGGLNSEIKAHTTRVLIESAYFSPTSVRRTAKRLGLSTDASHRFERGVDPTGTLYALNRAAQLMTELGEGRLITGVVDETNELPQPPVIDLEVDRTNRLLGTAIAIEEMKGLLEAIEFDVIKKDSNTLTVTTPSHRVDITRPQDLMEEIARRWGYDNIPVTYPVIPADTTSLNHLRRQRQQIRSALVGMGFSEAINYSFVHSASDQHLRLSKQDPRRRQLEILNPLTEDQSVMRTSLIPGLLETMHRNLSHQSRNLKLFEIGNTFISKGSDAQPEEIEILAGLWTGERTGGGWYDKATACDFYDLKGALEGLLLALHITGATFKRLPADQCAYTHPGVSARIQTGDAVLGTLGEIHPKVLDTYELKQTAYIFELNITQLTGHIPDAVHCRALPKYPSTSRDATLIIDQTTEADTLLEQIRQLDEPLVEDIRVFDVFTGEPISRGRKSVSLRVTYRSSETTLEDNLVNDLHTRLMSQLVKTFNADLPA